MITLDNARKMWKQWDSLGMVRQKELLIKYKVMKDGKEYCPPLMLDTVIDILQREGLLKEVVVK